MFFDVTVMHWVHNAVNLELFTRLYFTDKFREDVESLVDYVERDTRETEVLKDRNQT